MSTAPLEGLTVLEISSFVAAPLVLRIKHERTGRTKVCREVINRGARAYPRLHDG